MANETLTLEFSDKNYPFYENLQLLRSENTVNSFFTFNEDILYNWRLINGSWIEYRMGYADYKSVGQHVFSISDEKDLVISTNANGICLQLCVMGNLVLLSSRCFETFRNRKNNDFLLFGRFYNNSNEMGLILVEGENKIKFYKVSTENNDLFLEFNSSESLNLNLYCSKKSKFILAQLRKQLKQTLIGIHETCLTTFELDAEDNLKFVAQIEYEEQNFSPEDKIFFTNLSGNKDWMDMVVLTLKGLFVFQYTNRSANTFKLINNNPMFSEVKGWSDRHTQTVHFEDVDNDGFDEMIFTGPGGIEILSYNIHANKWKSLLNTEKLSAHERHARVLSVLPPQVENYSKISAMIFSYNEGVLHLANIFSEPAETLEIPPVNKKFRLRFDGSSVAPKNRNYTDANMPKSILYLRDQNIFFDYSNSVNPKSGKPSFVLPLVDDSESPVKFHLSYNGANTASSPLGIGWSTPQNFIISSYKEGNFQEDELFILIFNDFPYRLRGLFENCTTNVLIFEMQNATSPNKEINIRAEFSISSDHWVVKDDRNNVWIYGNYEKKFGAVITDTAWENWRGLGSDDIEQIERANMWYLAATISKGIKTLYEYETLRREERSSGATYNAGTVLKKISNQFREIIFFYRPAHLSSSGLFPSFLYSYTYNTVKTMQKIFFKYLFIENFLLLSEIEQESDYISESVLKMAYAEPLQRKFVIEGVIFPTGLEIRYEFISFGRSTAITENITKRVPVSDDYNVSYGPSYTLVTYTHEENNVKKVTFRMFVNDMSREIFPMKSYEWPSLSGPYGVETYEIFTADHFFIVVIYNSPFKSIFCFKNYRGDWMISPYQENLHEEATVLKGQNYILALDPNALMSYEWDSSKVFWRNSLIIASPGIQSCIATDDNKFVVYNDEYIYLGMKNATNPQEWMLKKLGFYPGRISGIKSILKKFNLVLTTEKALLKVFRDNVLQIKHNLIILSTLTLQNNTQLETKITTFVIGRNHEIVKERSTIIVQDDLSKFVTDVETNEDGDEFTLKYVYENGEFRIELASIIKNVSGESESQFKDQIIEKIYSKTDRFLLNLKNYHISFYHQTVICRNVKYYFGGAQWHRYEIPKNQTFDQSASVLLGERFVVNKTEKQSTFKLYDASNNRTLFDLGVREIDQIQINYPIFMAAQSPGNPVIVIEFIDGDEPKFKHTILPKSHELSPFGNAFSLVTHETGISGNKTVIIWPLFGIRRYLPNYVITSMKIIIPQESGGAKERVMGYTHNESSSELISGQIHYNDVQFYPGNNKTSYGYIQMKKNFVEYFNGEGTLVRKEEYKQKSSEKSSIIPSGEGVTKDSTLYDKYGRFEIASFSPFSIRSNMSGFVGFEDYEEIPLNWVFDPNDVIKGNFSFTGKNYLHLNEKSMKVIFKPQFQDRRFIASCWIRLPITKKQMARPGDLTPHLRGAVLTVKGDEIMHTLGNIKYQIDDWFYIEVLVDLYFTQLSLREVEEVRVNNPLEVEFRVSPSKSSPIDLDHLRFCPLDNIFDAKVYDEHIGKLVATIKSNGAIRRNFYNKYLRPIAEINESNQIEEFRTYTMDSYKPGMLNNPPCEIRISPERGFYVEFSNFQFRKQLILSNVDSWEIRPGTLHHQIKYSRTIFSKNVDIDENFYGLRFYYIMKTGNSAIVIPSIIEVKFTDNDKIGEQSYPSEGEMLFLKVGKRTIVWINGRLYMDEHMPDVSLDQILVQGDVMIQDMMVFSRPSIQVTYKNALNEEIQILLVSSSDTVVITEMLYDELGNRRITTVPIEIYRSPHMSLVAYEANFVTNDDPNTPTSVWKTGHLLGMISEILEHDFGFNEVVYENNPLNIQKVIGMAGKDFSVSGKYAIRFATTTSNSFVLAQYPPARNYTYQVKFMPYGREIISVFNKNGLKYASLVHVEGGKDRLSTFEYNEKGLLIQCLPPSYYDKMGRFNKTTLDLVEIPSKNNRAEVLEEIRISYDAKGNLIRLTTPDKGPLENIFDDENQLRFVIQYFWEYPDIIESVIYFQYDATKKLISTGSLKLPISKIELMSLNVTENNSKEFQHFYHSYFETDPVLREDKLLRTMTIYGDKITPWYEETILDSNNNVISKRFIEGNGSEKPVILSIDKRYDKNLLKEILYPIEMFGETFRVAYEYDVLGRMTSIGVPGQTDRFMKMTYNARNQIISEVVLPLRKNRFIRTYKYNDPGFLIRINDPFLSEEISYTEDSYSNRGYGDGSITRIKFIAKWHRSADSYGIGLDKNSFQNDVISAAQSRECFQELKEEGYLNSNNQQMRVFYADIFVNLSNACINETIRMEQRVNEILGRSGFPEEYGYRFEYGHFSELRKAKYFVGNADQEFTAFQSDTFSREIAQISPESSREIWNLLTSSGYIEKDNMGHGKPGISFLRQDLIENLKATSIELTKYIDKIQKILINLYSRSSLNVSLAEWHSVSNHWLPRQTSSDTAYNILSENGYFQRPIKSEFEKTLQKFSNHIPNIVRVMQKYRDIGRSEFDMETIKMDPNGNRILFYDGFENYHLKYSENGNRIRNISYWKGTTDADTWNKMYFDMGYNSHGNVNEAPHKKIRFIEYHPVSRRVQEVKMKNGDIINFLYDSQGERVMKRVTSGRGDYLSGIHYFRDDYGRTLVERKFTYVAPDLAPDILVTAYIYGPKSLIGFVRRSQFYSVITDHQGSVRLVVRDGEVVAAYDYTPYGGFMRVYGSNPDAHVSYRFTGQEWDPELGLYNFHARLYDPSIGRFLQVDPSMQFFSPYKYADNSPICNIDPNGKFLFSFAMSMIVLTLVGAYIAAASKNSSFNPFKWNWRSPETHLAIFNGGNTGLLIPLGYTSSMKVLGGKKSAFGVTTVGLTFAYMNAATVNHGKLDPRNWDYRSPHTWWAAFEGFSMGVNVLGGYYLSQKNFIALSRRQKYMYGGAAITFGSYSFASGGIQYDWDVSEIGFWFSTIKSVVTSTMILNFGISSFKFMKYQSKKFSQGVNKITPHILMNFGKLEKGNIDYNEFIYNIYQMNAAVIRTASSGLKLVIGPANFGLVFSSSAILINGDFHDWNSAQLSTYHNLLTATLLTARFFNSAKSAFGFVRPASTMPTKRLSDAVGEFTRTFTAAVADVQRADWRFVLVDGPVHQQFKPYSTPRVMPNWLITLPIASYSSLVYTRNHFIDPFFTMSYGEGHNNSNPKLLTIYEDPLFTQTVENVLDVLKTKYETSVYGSQICQDFNSIEETKFKESFGKSFTEICEIYSRSLFQYNIDRDLITLSLKEFTLINAKQIFPNQSSLMRIENELASVENYLKIFDTNFVRKRELLSRQKYLQSSIKNLKSHESAAIQKHFEELGDIFWNKYQKYRDMILTWRFYSYAEPPLKSPPIVEKSLKKKLPVPNAYDSTDDISLFSSYKFGNVPQLQPFQNCYNCINATPSVRDIVQDIGWLTLLNSHTQEHSKAEKLHKKRRRSVPVSSNFSRQTTYEHPFQVAPAENNGNLPRTDWNLLEFGDQVLSLVSKNESFFMAGVLLAKCCKRKIYKAVHYNEDPISKTEELACDIVELYEKSLIAAANASGIPVSCLNMNNNFELYEHVIEIFKTKKFENISRLVMNYASKALIDTECDFSSQEKFGEFMNFFKCLNINVKIDKLLIHLNGKD